MTGKKKKLDRIDYKILGILQADARIHNNELARQVNLSPSACLNRVNALYRDGYILSSHARLNLSKCCNYIIVICTVTLDEHTHDNFRSFEKTVLEIPELIECSKVSGQFDYILRFICKDMDNYHSISEKLLDGDSGIANIHSHVVLDQTKVFTAYPLNHLTG